MKDKCVCMHAHVCVCVFYMLTAKEQLRENVCHEGLKTYKQCLQKTQHSLHIIQIIPQHI